MTRFLDTLDRFAMRALPLFARIVFAAVLLRYFWSSALTKLDGPFSPTLGAYAQIFPRQMEAAGYDVSQFGAVHWVVVMAGAYAELLLPLLLVIGLASRLAALGMIGFVIVQSLTDIIGHGADSGTIGRFFDSASDAVILDQRALWMMVFVTIAGLGGGHLSVDAWIKRRQAGARSAPVAHPG